MTPFEAEVGQSVEYLASDLAHASIRQDPYWPKWDSPWWHMTLLWEMGLAERIPHSAVESMVETFGSHFLSFFPLRFDLLPPDIDTRRQAACHCAVGTMYQVLSACGVDLDEEIPWMRPWFFRYQLPDGGLNCDEEVYVKPTPKSSIVSTLPPLEAVLFYTERELTFEEVEFLDRGAEYLIDHRLYRARRGEVINPGWLELCFPRFYFYDVLRGLRFLARWAVVRGRSLPETMVDEVAGEIRKSLDGAGLVPGRRSWSASTTLMLGEDGEWVEKQPVTWFSLLEAVSRTDVVSPTLTRLWEAVEADLAQV